MTTRSRAFVRGTLAALAMVILAAAAAHAQATRVLGRVTDGVGNAIAGATVTLVAEDGTQAERAVTSGASGGFQFDDVPPGTWVVRAERPGFAPRQARVRVRPGRVVTTVVRLPRARRTGAGDTA